MLCEKTDEEEYEIWPSRTGDYSPPGGSSQEPQDEERGDKGDHWSRSVKTFIDEFTEVVETRKVTRNMWIDWMV